VFSGKAIMPTFCSPALDAAMNGLRTLFSGDEPEDAVPASPPIPDVGSMRKLKSSHIVATFALFAAAAAVAGAGCRSQQAAPRSPTPAPTSEATEASLPTSFLIRRFRSFAEAQEALGVSFAEPHGFTLAWGDLIAQPADDPTFLQAVYIGPEGKGIHLDVLLPPLWQDGPPSGGLRKAVIGSKEGLIISDDEFGREFAFRCSSRAEETIWCVVGVPREFGDEVLEQFVASMR
jgi:hypothetical protein